MEEQSAEPEMIGRIRVFGEHGRRQIAKEFVDALGELTPSQRRLALARACALPWRDRPALLPDCYGRELEAASWEAREEERGRGASPSLTVIDGLLDPENLPISELFLRQLIPLRPSYRRCKLARSCMSHWKVMHRPAPEPAPEWLARFCAHTIADEAEDFQLDQEQATDA